MSDLGSRLRAYLRGYPYMEPDRDYEFLTQAADEIERLTSENKLQWENIQKLLAENERLTGERDEARQLLGVYRIQRDHAESELERIAECPSEECARDPFLCKAWAREAVRGGK